MKTYSRLGTVLTLLLVIIISISTGAAAPLAGKPPTATPTLGGGGATATPTTSGSANYTITVGATYGTTELSIGANEACMRFNVADMTDLGIKNYRLYSGMERVEPTDDDGVFGSPTITQIKANVNTIPWATWDSYFNRTDAYWWSSGCVSQGTSGTNSLHDMLTQLTANGISPVIVLRNVEDQNPTWAWNNLNPPNTPEDWNEWWEYVFAWVYTANVRYNLHVDDWEVHNEPDKGGQLAGWGGTQADYVALIQQTADAINYVYATYLSNRPHRIYAPVSAGANTWVTYSLQNADAQFNVVDWHRYGDPVANAQTLNGQIDQYNSDGFHEPLMLSEWGSYSGGFGTVSSALSYATQLLHHSLAAPSNITYSSIFSMYDWTSSVTGLMAGNGTPHEDYYAFRLITRGLQSAKTAYSTTDDIPANVAIEQMVSTDPATGTIYVEIINNTAQDKTIQLDLTALTTSGTATLREYSASVKDAVTGTANIVNGKVIVTVHKSSIRQVIK